MKDVSKVRAARMAWRVRHELGHRSFARIELYHDYGLASNTIDRYIALAPHIVLRYADRTAHA